MQKNHMFWVDDTNKTVLHTREFHDAEETVSNDICKGSQGIERSNNLQAYVLNNIRALGLKRD